MKKHFLKIEDKSYRVEVNMRTAEAWENISGLKIGQFEVQAAESAATGGLPTKYMFWWLYCSLVEGENQEGREFPYTLEQLKSAVKPSILTHFAPIFLECYLGGGKVASNNDERNAQKKKKKIRSMFTYFIRSPWVRLAGVLIFITMLGRLIYLLL